MFNRLELVNLILATLSCLPRLITPSLDEMQYVAARMPIDHLVL